MTKSNEENIAALKSYLTNMAEQLNYQMSYLAGRVADLEAKIESEKGEDK